MVTRDDATRLCFGSLMIELVTFTRHCKKGYCFAFLNPSNVKVLENLKTIVNLLKEHLSFEKWRRSMVVGPHRPRRCGNLPYFITYFFVLKLY